jgi:DNA mismatch endonuclease (patch repair protein)
MRAVARTDTAPEVLFRGALHRAGLRFRKERRPLPGLRCKADVVFPARKVCVFLDGCFWHRCPIHFRLPTANAAWWDEKVQATVDRDRRQTALLEAAGWTVVRVWEHDLAADGLAGAVARVVEAVRAAK